MKLATCLLIIQLGYILAAAVNVPPCQNHLENLRIVRSDEPASVTPENNVKNPENLFENGLITKVNDKKVENVPKVATNFNVQQLKPHSLNDNPENLGKWPTSNKIENKSKINSIPVTYQAIDPKNIFIYGLYPPKPSKSPNTNDTRTAVNIKVSKMIPDDNDLNKDGEILNDTIQTDFKTANWSADITNIRELRADLLKHLLDYFLNIIKEENNQNATRKKNDKDVIRVENKLTNYYGPQSRSIVDHLDLYDGDFDYGNDYDLGNNDYRRKSDDRTEISFDKNDSVDEKNATKVGSVEMLKNDTKIEIIQSPWQRVNKDILLYEVSNKTIMIPVIEDYEDSIEIVASKKHTNFEKNETIFEVTEKPIADSDDVSITTDKNDILEVTEPIDVTENITNDFLYTNEDEENLENIYYEDYPDSNDYVSIENDTIVPFTVNKTKNNKNLTELTTDRQTDNEIAIKRTLNDDLDINSDVKIDKTKKDKIKVDPLKKKSVKNGQFNENIVILTSPDSDEEDLAIKVNHEGLKSKKSSKKQKKHRKNRHKSCSKSFVLNLNIALV